MIDLKELDEALKRMHRFRYDETVTASDIYSTGQMAADNALIEETARAHASLLRGEVVDGRRLVPVEPTVEMSAAGSGCNSAIKATNTGVLTLADAHGIYKTMINAAPIPCEQEQAVFASEVSLIDISGNGNHAVQKTAPKEESKG